MGLNAAARRAQRKPGVDVVKKTTPFVPSEAIVDPQRQSKGVVHFDDDAVSCPPIGLDGFERNDAVGLKPVRNGRTRSIGQLKGFEPQPIFPFGKMKINFLIFKPLRCNRAVVRRKIQGHPLEPPHRVAAEAF